MKRLFPVAVLVVLLAIPATASAANSRAEGFASAECRQDRREKPRKFKRKFGVGSRALERCIRAEIRDARGDCRRNARQEPREYRREYGTGSRAFGRCVLNELR
jgi:hypothetical protein